MKTWKAVLIDRDGVLVTAKDGAVIPGADVWMEQLVQRRIPFVIATNHTTSGPEDAADMLRAGGFPVGPEQMHTPLTILMEVLRETPPGKMFISGTESLKTYLLEKGFKTTELDKADTLLMGFNQSMTYQMLSGIIDALITRDIRWIALHENRLYKNASGRYEPGLGAWVRAVSYATGKTPVIMGKPNPFYYQKALEKLGVSPDETLMISDDPLGDLQGAARSGLKTIFVLSGKYTDTSILKQTSFQPDMICSDISQVPFPD